MRHRASYVGSKEYNIFRSYTVRGHDLFYKVIFSFFTVNSWKRHWGASRDREEEIPGPGSGMGGVMNSLSTDPLEKF